MVKMRSRKGRKRKKKNATSEVQSNVMCRKLNNMKSGGCYLNLFADMLQFYSADEALLLVLLIIAHCFQPKSQSTAGKKWTIHSEHFRWLNKCAVFIYG